MIVIMTGVRQTLNLLEGKNTVETTSSLFLWLHNIK